mmetsp:Transcript_37334/g.93782  ORF Transcript_37334/g.93782 Transcript_37334/m.93782 type:complete len:204 (+) Transcript_37334:427-1038(+)
MVCAEAEGVQGATHTLGSRDERSELPTRRPILTIREEEDCRDRIALPPMLGHRQARFQTLGYVSASPSCQAQGGCCSFIFATAIHPAQPERTFGTGIEGHNAQPILWLALIDHEAHGTLNETYFLPSHGATDIQYADQIQRLARVNFCASCGSSLSLQGHEAEDILGAATRQRRILDAGGNRQGPVTADVWFRLVSQWRSGHS